MSNNSKVVIYLDTDDARLMAGLAKGESRVQAFGKAVKDELSSIGQFAGAVGEQLGQIGLDVSPRELIARTAELDKALARIKQTSGGTADEVGRLRESLLTAQAATGQGSESLLSGVDALIASGSRMTEVIAAIDPMAKAMVVAQTDAGTLAKAMDAVSGAFDIDLGQADQARLLLEQMVVAGRAGNVALENMPALFGQIGAQAKSANLGVGQTLSLVETLSKAEPDAGRLAKLADSTLNAFTDTKQMRAAQKATGVRFFEDNGSRRDTLQVLGELEARYDSLGNDRARSAFLTKAFGKTSPDARQALKALLDGNALGSLDSISAQVDGASGTLARDVRQSMDNPADQTARLNATLFKAIDGLSQPLTSAWSKTIAWGLDRKADGGLELDGSDLLIGGLMGGASLYGAKRLGGKALSKLLGGTGDMVSGLATGKALEAVAGVQPVYVVNMPKEMGGLSVADKAIGAVGEAFSPKTFGKLRTTAALLGASELSAIPVFGVGAMATAGAAVVAAGATGYGVGTLINDNLLTDEGPLGSEVGAKISNAIGEAVAYLISPFSAEARAAIEANQRATEVKGNIAIKIESSERVSVTQLQSTGVELSTSALYTGAQGF
jgi:Phage-related minor tail protein